MTPDISPEVVSRLRQGALIAYPTEAVWGVGCDPFNEAAVQGLLTLKQRPMEKGLILVAASIEQFAPLLTALNPAQYQQLQATWPGFQTWLVPAAISLPLWLTGGHDRIALRVSAHPTVQALCHAFAGPLVSTSANPAGQAPALNAQQVRDYFADQVMVVEGETGGACQPSSIVDLLTGQRLR